MLSAGTNIRNGYLPHMSAKWLHHPCRLGDPQRLARGPKTEMATWPTCGQSRYITPAAFGVPNAAQENKKQKRLPSPHVAKVAESPLPTWGPPTLSARTKDRNGYVAHMWARRLHHHCRLGGPQRSARGRNLEMATWPATGQSGYITLVFLGVPNDERENKEHKWLPRPHVAKVDKSALPSWGSATLSCGKKKKWLRGPHVGEVATSPLLSRGSPTLSAGTKNQKWLPAYITLTSWGSPMLSAQIKTINGYLAHTLPKWLQYPSRLGGPQHSRRGQK